MLEYQKITKSKSKCIFTIVRNEPIFLPLWLNHHSKMFDYIFVIFHQSYTKYELDLCREYDVEYVVIHNPSSYCWLWITETANEFSKFLLKSFRAVVYADVDELLIDTDDILNKPLPAITRCTGYAIHHHVNKEKPLVTSKSISEQRVYYTDHGGNGKPIVKTDPKIEWDMGFHHLIGHPYIPANPHLYLIHMHFIDYDIMVKRHKTRGQFDNISEFEKIGHFGGHNFLYDGDQIKNWLQQWESDSKQMNNQIANLVDSIDLSTLGDINL